jgi:hypothetical protein
VLLVWALQLSFEFSICSTPVIAQCILGGVLLTLSLNIVE